MQVQSSFLTPSPMPVALYSSEQLYLMEQAWFAEGHDSFGLMQQAAWQMTHCIVQQYEQQYAKTCLVDSIDRQTQQRRASVWVGIGNNGGDGWLIAYYLQQMGWQVEVVAVGFEADDFKHGSFDTNEITNKPKHADGQALTDAKKAQRLALSANCEYQHFIDSADNHDGAIPHHWQADVYIDALFGIGLDRAPTGVYKQAIRAFNQASSNQAAKYSRSLAIAVDVPSGLVASTGEVFDHIAIQADMTLCLIARKFGLHTKDGMDHSGTVIDIPLIPCVLNAKAPVATLITTAHGLDARRQNSYKGSYGHVLVIGGNRIDGSQGMGGAAILSASSSMATGTGKITVACHDAFHGALLTSLPDAMTIDLHDKDGVSNLIKEASVVAIGMGLGRDQKAEALFIHYTTAAIAEKKPIVIDADGLYHLASLQRAGHQLIAQLKKYSVTYPVCLTPHSGEAARLLDKKVSEVESDRRSTIMQCANIYGGDWVLKGAGSLVLEQQLEQHCIDECLYVCGVGNAGMATAGMGDVLAGVIAGLLAQQDLKPVMRGIHQAVLIHGLAGDILVDQTPHNAQALLIGQRGLQAQDMPVAIRHVMQRLIGGRQ